MWCAAGFGIIQPSRSAFT